MMSSKPYFLPILLLCLSGCTTAATVGRDELSLYGKNAHAYAFETIAGNIKYANDLSGVYIDHATEAAAGQDIAALAIIGAAATAVGGATYGSSLDLIRGAGLAAGTTTAVTNHLRPGEASLALLNAAEQMVCIATAGHAADLGIADSADGQKIGGEIMKTGITQVRIKLRKKLSRQLPDYATLLNQISGAINASLEDRQLSTDVDAALKELHKEVGKCVLREV